VCQVPPGSFWELNVVRECPRGLYRAAFVRTDDRSAISCLSCPEGWTTAATATPAVGMCNGEQLAQHMLIAAAVKQQAGGRSSSSSQ
jgi:hypothetical protein